MSDIELRSVNKHAFSGRLKTHRVGRKLTIKEISKLIGVSRNTYAAWEDPNKPELPREMNTIFKLDQVLGMGMHFMISGALEHEQDERFTTRRDKLSQRQAKDPEFNLLIKYLEDMSAKKIKALLDFIDDTPAPSGRRPRISRTKRYGRHRH